MNPTLYHITWVTHNSRISSRMSGNKIILGKPLLLDEESEVAVTKIIAGIVTESNSGGKWNHFFRIHTYNICRDHVHLIIECPDKNLSNIIRLLKGKSAQLYKEYLGIDPDKEFHLWAQKYNKWRIESDEQLYNTIAYINGNRQKHNLPENKGLQPLVLSIISLHPHQNKGL